MILATIGAPVDLKFRPVSLSDLVVGRKGEIFAIYIKAQGIQREKSAEYLIKLKEAIEDNNAKLLYGAVLEDAIFLQIEGSPFPWAALLTALPAILTALGVFIIAVSVFQATSRNEWVLPLIILGTVAFIFRREILDLVFGGFKIRVFWGGEEEEEERRRRREEIEREEERRRRKRRMRD